MSLAKIFGSKKPKEAEPTPQDAIQRLRQTEEMLTKKSDFLEKKIQDEVQTAKKNGTKNTRGKNTSVKQYCVSRVVKYFKNLTQLSSQFIRKLEVAIKHFYRQQLFGAKKHLNLR